VLLLIKKCAIIFLLFSWCSSIFAKDSGQDLIRTVRLGQGDVVIRLEPRDVGCSKKVQIQLNKLFCAVVTLTPSKADSIKDLKLKSFDAVMPAHRHGMVTRARIQESKSGEYLIEGLKFHMPGDWSFKVNLVLGKESAEVAIPLKL
jgi:hypothetical protein